MINTYRRFEVGADATDARADNPGSMGGMELHPGKVLVSSLSLNLSSLASAGCCSGYSADVVECGSIERW